MQGITSLKISLLRFRTNCLEKVLSGLTFVQCRLFRMHEEVVTDHLRISKGEVRVLDLRE